VTRERAEVAGTLASLKPQVVLVDPAGVAVLRTSRARRVWLLVGALVFCLAGLVVLASSEGVFWSVAGAVLFAAGGLIFLVQLLLPDSLALSRDELCVSSLGRRTRIAWVDVAEFGVLQLPVRGGSNSQVGIRLKAPSSTLRRRMTSGVAGRFDRALPDTYGLTVEGLCALLEEWRDDTMRR
jgi:hypothetical protein